MSLPELNLTDPPKDLVVALINNANATHLDPQDIELSDPISDGHRHARIMVIPSDLSPLSGRVEVTYQRYSLNYFFFGIPIHIQTNDDVTKEMIQEIILNRYQANLSPEEFDIETETFGEHYPYKVVVKARDTSLVWVGSFELWVHVEGDLGMVFNDHAISFNDNTKKVNAFPYSVDRNLAEWPQDVIDYLTVGRSINTLSFETMAMLRALQDQTGDPWVLKNQIEDDFNIYGADVVYHGELDDSGDQVIVIGLGRWCTNLRGLLFIPYTP